MADKAQIGSVGGQYATVCAANTAVAVSNSPGRICKLFFLTNFSNTVATTIYDNTAAGGTGVYITLANSATSSQIDLQIPVANGIYWGGGTNTPPVVITYTKDGAYGL